MVRKRRNDRLKMYNKGDIVEITGHTYAGYLLGNMNKRQLLTIDYSKPVKGMIVGYSFLRTGERVPANSYDYEPAFLMNITDHKVWLVEPLNNNRYLKPIRCQEHQIKRVVK